MVGCPAFELFAMHLQVVDGKPPREQLRVCSTVKHFPQTHWEGKFGGRQP